MSQRCSALLLAGLLLVLTTTSSCALTRKKIAPKHTYRAGYLASTDGKRYRPLLDLLDDAEKAKPACRSINHTFQTKAQYTIERRDSGISLKMTECESPEHNNCPKLEKCLAARPVAWLTRASGRTPEHSGTLYNDWLGRCGGMVAVNFYFGPQSTFPIERVGCAEPEHDKVDTAHEMFLMARPDVENMPSAIAAIEALLKKWTQLVFTESDALPKL